MSITVSLCAFNKMHAFLGSVACLVTGTWLNRACIESVFQDDILSILGFLINKTDNSLFRSSKAYSFMFLYSFSTQILETLLYIYI